MKNDTRHALVLILMLTVLVVGVVLVGIGGKNYIRSDKIARLIEPSQVIETLGYKSIEEWKRSYKINNLMNVAIGAVLICVAGGVAAFFIKKR